MKTLHNGGDDMVQRVEYLKKLHSWKNEEVIKVVTGIRRCGKSTLLKQYKELLLSEGVKESQIVYINFEELENEELTDYKTLFQYLNDNIDKNNMNYIFLDEIQMVESYEKVVNSFYVKDYVDMYITGSNSYMLSSDLATLLTGRYIEIKMLPLSFYEFQQFSGEDKETAFANYMKKGGLPYISRMNYSEEKGNIYLEGVYNTVIIKDVEERQRRRETDSNKRKITDIVLLKTIAKYLASVIGNPVSIKGITDYLISNGRKVSDNTISDYVEALIEAFVFYDVERFDIVKKEILKTNRKYYMVDLGLRNHILPKKSYDLGFSLENIVFFELLRRGYRVNIGKVKNMEVDFVAHKDDEIVYYQVTADMTSEETFDRELKPLRLIKDYYEKIVLTLDKFTEGNYEGIKVVNVIDWLLFAFD